MFVCLFFNNEVDKQLHTCSCTHTNAQEGKNVIINMFFRPCIYIYLYMFFVVKEMNVIKKNMNVQWSISYSLIIYLEIYYVRRIN